MKPRTLTTILLTILLIPALGQTQFVPSTAVVSVDTVEVLPGAAFRVPVRMASSSVNFVGLQIPLQFQSSHVTVDSISFIGSLKPSGSNGAGHIGSGEVLISYYPGFSPPPYTSVAASEGLLAIMHGRVSAAATPGVIAIDSIYQSGLKWVGIGFSDANGMGMYTPAGFVGGALKVLSPTGVGDNADGLPSGFTLAQNYPNPFNPVTMIEFTLPRASQVHLDVYNVLGQRVEQLVDNSLAAGTHQIVFDGSGHPSGIYFYRLTHTAGTQTQKMILLK